jgi:hypothetical protein
VTTPRPTAPTVPVGTDVVEGQIGQPVEESGIRVNVTSLSFTDCPYPAPNGPLMAQPGQTFAEVTVTLTNVSDPYELGGNGTSPWWLDYGPDHTDATESLTTCAELNQPNGISTSPVQPLTEGVTRTYNLEFSIPGEATGLRLRYNGDPLTTGQIIIDLGQ